MTALGSAVALVAFGTWLAWKGFRAGGPWDAFFGGVGTGFAALGVFLLGYLIS